MLRPPPEFPLFPYTTLFRSHGEQVALGDEGEDPARQARRFDDGTRHIAAGSVVGAARQFFEEEAHLEELAGGRSEEHTSELQSHVNLVCRLLLEKKKTSRVSEHRTQGQAAVSTPHPNRLRARSPAHRCDSLVVCRERALRGPTVARYERQAA